MQATRFKRGLGSPVAVPPPPPVAAPPTLATLMFILRWLCDGVVIVVVLVFVLLMLAVAPLACVVTDTTWPPVGAIVIWVLDVVTALTLLLAGNDTGIGWVVAGVFGVFVACCGRAVI